MDLHLLELTIMTYASPRTQIIASFEPQIEQRKGLLLCHLQALGAVRT